MGEDDLDDAELIEDGLDEVVGDEDDLDKAELVRGWRETNS